MSNETFALINDQDQVVNHIIIDKDDANFESNMADQLTHWGCVRYVETDAERDLIVLDESPEIWTTHTEETGFVVPDGYGLVEKLEDINKPVVIKRSELPADALMLEENAHLRPAGFIFPENVTIIEGQHSTQP